MREDARAAGPRKADGRLVILEGNRQAMERADERRRAPAAGRPRRRARGTSSSGSFETIALTCGLTRAIRSRCACITSRAETCLVWMRAASSRAPVKHSSGDADDGIGSRVFEFASYIVAITRRPRSVYMQRLPVRVLGFCLVVLGVAVPVSAQTAPRTEILRRLPVRDVLGGRGKRVAPQRLVLRCGRKPDPDARRRLPGRRQLQDLRGVGHHRARNRHRDRRPRCARVSRWSARERPRKLGARSVRTGAGRRHQ